MMRSGGLIVLVTMGLLLAVPAYSGNYMDDVCPDEGGKSFIVDTSADALVVADNYNRPDCRLVIRTSIGRNHVSGSTLHISAKSITIEGPLEIENGLVDSRIVLSAADGDVSIAGARIIAQGEIRLECRAPATCAVGVSKHSLLRANRAIRTQARGSVTFDDVKMVAAETESLRLSAQP
jgi:hypothetical protein